MDMNLENQMRMDRPQGLGQQSHESAVLGVCKGAQYACLPPTSPPGDTRLRFQLQAKPPTGEA